MTFLGWIVPLVFPGVQSYPIKRGRGWGQWYNVMRMWIAFLIKNKKTKKKSVAIRSLQIWCSVVESGMVIDVLVGWHGCPVTRCKGRVWRAVTIMHFLGVWLGRSRRVFKGTIFWDGFKGLAYEFFLWIFSEQFCFVLLLLTFTFLTYVSINFLL